MVSIWDIETGAIV
jgi:WD40 repeat protein